ncbi:MAG: TonB-dependent receptor [Asticcacaulis sp.]
MKTKLLATVAIMIAAGTAQAETTDVTEVVVTGQRSSQLMNKLSPISTGSRLGLSARETPATTETLSQTDMQVLGLRTSREAYSHVVGAISGNVPGNPAVVGLRGYSGGAVSILQDGLRISTSTMVVRDNNTWHYDRIEVIKGPASVLYGEGALAGVINRVTRKPVLEGNFYDGLISLGSFNTKTVAGGANLRLSDTVALRLDASNLRSDSLYDVDNNDTRSTGLTGSLLWKPSDKLTLLFAVDHFDDKYEGTYQGLPLVSETVARKPSKAFRSTNGMVIDEALRHINYNPDGAYSSARETTLRSRVDYRIGEGWSLANDLTWYTAKRDFVLSGDQIFRAPSMATGTEPAFPNGSFTRSVQRIIHDHDFWNERLTASYDGQLGGRRNRFTMGVEYNETDFVNPRQQSPVYGSVNDPLAPVDIFNPEIGVFPSGNIYTSGNNLFESRMKTASVFLENAYNLSPRWLVVAGARYDHTNLERKVINLNAGNSVTMANPTYKPFSWRIGTTYDVTPKVTIYGQYTTAITPVGSSLTLSIANTRYELTKGKSAEAGFKASAFENRLTATGAMFRITQENILTRDPANPSQVVQGGEQSSTGIELSLGYAVTERFLLSGGAAYTKAEYEELIEAGGADRSGNRPINTPTTTANLSGFYTLKTLPVTLGATAHHVSGFYTDTANSYFVLGRTTLDASVAWKVNDKATLTLRGRNLTDAFYGEYSGYASTNIYIGAPRSVEIALSTRF